jgi:hypothetical protein
MLDEQIGTETAAPDAPAGTIAAAPAVGTQSAIDAARQRLAEAGTMLPTETDTEKAAREAAEVLGTGASSSETPEQKVARETEEATAAAQATETEEEKAAREVAEAAAASETHPELMVTLAPIEDRGEQPISIEAPDQETFQRLNRLQNEAALGRQVKSERRGIERQFEQLEAVEDQIGLDPAGFVLERVAEAVRPDVAMHLLFDPGILEAVQERLAAAGVEGGLAGVLENPDALRVLRAELKSGRLELREQLRGQADQRRQLRASAQRVAGQIEALIPESIVGEERDRLYSETVRDVSERCRRLGIQKLAAEDVALLVGDRFRQQGIAPAPARAEDGNGKPAAKPPAPVGRTAAQFQQDQDARRKAAAAAPAGVGAPAAKPRPTLPPTTEGRIALIRKIGLRAALGKP